MLVSLLSIVLGSEGGHLPTFYRLLHSTNKVDAWTHNAPKDPVRVP